MSCKRAQFDAGPITFNLRFLLPAPHTNSKKNTKDTTFITLKVNFIIPMIFYL